MFASRYQSYRTRVLLVRIPHIVDPMWEPAVLKVNLRRRYSALGGDRVLSNWEGGSRGSVSGLVLLSKTELQMY